MNACDIPGIGLRVSPDAVPLPAVDIAAGDDSGEAILAGGCFWCTEAVFRRLQGVTDVVPGYIGGDARRADYRSVCEGDTGHAEAIRIRYDPAQISYGALLRVFFAVAHDATQLNRQGNDVGTQYRSAIFPLDAAQEQVARAYLQQLSVANVFASAPATTIEPGHAFHAAEAYHHDYAAKNPAQPYIRAVSQPKVEKLEHYFANRLA